MHYRYNEFADEGKTAIEPKPKYKDFKFKLPKWHYSFQQGETRIGDNRPDGDTSKASHEILIIKE